MQPNDPINPDNQTNTQNPISPGDTISPLPPVDNIQASNEPTSIPVNTPSNTEAAPSQTSVNSDANISANIDANITTQPVQQDTTAPSQSYAAPMPDAQQNPNLTIVNNVPKQKKSPVAAIIIILLLILLAGGGAAAYFILGKKKTTMTDQQTNNSLNISNNAVTATKTFKSDELKFQFDYPETWGEATMGPGKLLEQQKGKYNEITFSSNANVKINLVLGHYGSALDACGYDDPVKNAENDLIGKKASVIGWENKDIKQYVLDFNGQGSDVATIIKVSANSTNPSERWTEISSKDKVLEYKDLEQPETTIKAGGSGSDCSPITQMQADEANSYFKIYHYAVNYSNATIKGINANFDARKADDTATRTQIISALNGIQTIN